MDRENYIDLNPRVMLGKPVITGRRITVELIQRKLRSGYTVDDLLKSYPHLSKEQVLAVSEYAAKP